MGEKRGGRGGVRGFLVGEEPNGYIFTDKVWRCECTRISGSKVNVWGAKLGPAMLV